MYEIFYKNRRLIFSNTSPSKEEFYRMEKKAFRKKTPSVLRKFVQDKYNTLPVWVEGDPDKNFSHLKKEISEIRAGGGLVSNSKKELLLIFRRGVWDLPKGKLDKGETIEQCAIREVCEECGISDVILKQHFADTWHLFYDKYDRKTLSLKRTSWFLMEHKGGKLFPQKEEDIERAIWGKKEQIRAKLPNTYGTIRSLLENYLSGK